MNENVAQQRLHVVLNHLSPNIQRIMALYNAMNESYEWKQQQQQLEHENNYTFPTAAPTTAPTPTATPPFGSAQVSKYQKGDTGFKPSLVTYLSPHELVTQESLQAGVLLVAHPRADVRREFINRLCQAAVEKSALVYAIAPSGSLNVEVEGVYTLSTHPTLSRRAILNALLRHGAHLLVFGTISTRDDVMALMDATYTGYHCVAEIYGDSAHDVLSRLEAIGVDVSMLPQNLRVIVPTAEKM